VVQQNRITVFWRHPHAAARAILPGGSTPCEVSASLRH
jgi:hypothetical protein